jgi:hypothetical protein
MLRRKKLEQPLFRRNSVCTSYARPGGHLYFSRIAGTHVDLLLAAGRDEQAANCARQYLEPLDPRELGNGDADLYAAAALALGRGGEPRRAAQLLDNAIASQQMSRIGIPLGQLSYARARIASAISDRPAFEHFGDLCAQEFKRSKNLMMIAKFERLLEEAAQSAVAPTSDRRTCANFSISRARSRCM